MKQVNLSILIGTLCFFGKTIENMKSNNNQIGDFGKVVEDFERTFKEIAKASHGLANMAEQLSSLNVNLTEKLTS